MPTPLHYRSASDLAAAIRSREVSAQEVLEDHLAQIGARNGRINAIVTLDEERARVRARDADASLAKGENWGPLHGVPVTIKDAFETAGLRTTSGFRPLKEHVPTQDAVCVARLRAAGAIILGKTNLAEMAGDEQTHNSLFGRTNNPWNLERTPGGSSGGSAAAVAAGLSPLDIGSDIGGSVRNPAAFCGIFSLKPSDSRVPFVGHIPPLPGARGRGLLRYAMTPGPLARSVEDLRLALTLMAGPSQRQWEVPPMPLQPVPQPNLSDLRIAWTDDFGLPVSAEIRAALKDLAEKLSRQGSRVERASPPEFDFGKALQVYGELKEAAFTAKSSPLGLPRFVWRLVSGLVSPENSTTYGLIRGAGSNLRDYAAALSLRDRFIDQMEQFLSNWDVWLCPTAVRSAYPHIQTRTIFEQLNATVEVDGRKIPYILATSVYTALFNLTGNPVVVLPLGTGADGLPIGIQAAGKRWRDMELLAAAEAISAVSGDFHAPPGF